VSDEKKDSLELEIEEFGLEDFETEPEEGQRNTPSDTREAMNAAVFRAERYSKKAAFYSFKAYQIAVKGEQRLEAVEREVDNIKRQGFRLPNALATGAFVISIAALLLVGCVITGRLAVQQRRPDTSATLR
jgi:hypothetical protein